MQGTIFFQLGECCFDVRVLHSNTIISVALIILLLLYHYTDPFLTAVKLGVRTAASIIELLVFEEHPHVSNTHWLTDIPIKVSSRESICVIILYGG
jgi:hypothetical protein